MTTTHKLLRLFICSFLVVLINHSNITAQNSALSIHLWGNDNYKGDIIMKTLKVPHKTLYTYYCALMWNIGYDAGGYCGMQNSPSGNNFIFSLWDPISSNEAIEAHFIGQGTEVSRFGGEGTGLKSMNYGVGWAEGHDYQLVARSWNVGAHTFFGYWVNDISSNNWMHLVTMDYPVSKVRFDGSTGSFLEDWSSSGQNMRKVYQKDAYKRLTNKSWYPFNSVSFAINTNDIGPGARSYNYRNNYDAGIENGYYFMQSGGATTPSFSGNGIDLTNSFSLEPEVSSIQFYITEANENSISWTVPQSSTPQFRFKIEMNGAVLADTVAPEVRTFNITASNGNFVFLTLEDILGNETTKKISIGTASLAPTTPMGLTINDFGSSSFSVSWDTAQNAETYEVQIQKNFIWEPVGSTQLTSYTFTNLEGRTKYKARVSAKNSFGQSSFTDYVWALTGVNNENIIPNTNWTLHYVDSEETTGEDGAATNAFDGDETTFWHTEWDQSTPTHPHEIQINLGSAYSITGFKYLPRQDGGVNGTIADYEFYLSSDGSNWGNPVASGIFESTQSLKEVTFAAAEGSYVRLVALSEINGGEWTSMAELTLVGTPVVGITEGQTSLLKDYKLYNAYPNPFNPVTNIAFSIPKESRVKISVYDLLGKEVINLVNDNYNAGQYNVIWNAVNYSSGTYFYTIEADGFYDTQKIVLLK